LWDLLAKTNAGNFGEKWGLVGSRSRLGLKRMRVIKEKERIGQGLVGKSRIVKTSPIGLGGSAETGRGRKKASNFFGQREGTKKKESFS